MEAWTLAMFGVQGLNQYLRKLLAGTCTMEGLLMLWFESSDGAGDIRSGVDGIEVIVTLSSVVTRSMDRRKTSIRWKKNVRVA